MRVLEAAVEGVAEALVLAGSVRERAGQAPGHCVDENHRRQLAAREDVRADRQRVGREVLHDPWTARDAYIDVLLDRRTTDEFLAEHSPPAADHVLALTLLEAQRHALLMYTSCGWFFDEISGIETVQVLKYAARVIQLAGELGG